MNCRIEIVCGSEKPIDIASGLINRAEKEMYERIALSNDEEYIDKQMDVMIEDIEEIGKHLLDYVAASRRRLYT